MAFRFNPPLHPTTRKQLKARLDKIVAGIEFDRFTLENVQALIRDLDA